MEYRYANNQIDPFLALAAELVKIPARRARPDAGGEG
jgi:hypothetical protein